MVRVDAFVRGFQLFVLRHCGLLVAHHDNLAFVVGFGVGIVDVGHVCAVRHGPKLDKGFGGTIFGLFLRHVDRDRDGVGLESGRVSAEIFKVGQANLHLKLAVHLVEAVVHRILQQGTNTKAFQRVASRAHHVDFVLALVANDLNHVRAIGGFDGLSKLVNVDRKFGPSPLVKEESMSTEHVSLDLTMHVSAGDVESHLIPSKASVLRI